MRELSLLMAVFLAGCTSPPPRTAVIHESVVSPARLTTVHVYPAAGQTAAQLDRDRYGCHQWAVQQSGFDPSRADLASHQRISVQAVPPAGTATIAGAATGAVLGAVVAAPSHTGSGAVVGAVAGGLIGATADSARQQDVDRENQALQQRQSRRQSILERKADGYRRAISACLVGRGYTVQ